ncbi:MAG TPA: helix-turn-helix domain-containing protein [Armatimonadota bacterium]|jgi:excisionase family DNA binding protein
MEALTQRGGLSIPDAAAYLGISTSHAWNMARSGELPTIRLRKRVIVPTWALVKILRGEQQEEGEAA